MQGQAVASESESRPPLVGRWRAWLDCPGGELPFGLTLAHSPDLGWTAMLHNGEERIDVPVIVAFRPPDSSFLTLRFPHYDASISAMVSEDGMLLDGEYKKRLGKERWRNLPFHAVLLPAATDAEHASARFEGMDAAQLDLSGRWRMDFDSSDDPAVGIFEQTLDGLVTGTVLTTTGDYRYLAGSLRGEHLRLSVFDGAHSFLFDATVGADGGLSGDFWSGDTWHETWTGKRDDDITLANAFEETRWHELASLGDVLLPDADNRMRSLADPDLRGAATLIVLFGTWCPNCHDEAPYLVELQKRFGPRGLRVIGLAFELTADYERDNEQLRRFAERYDIEYPILLAGTSNKSEATLAFPGVDFVRSFPTTLFVDNGGHVRWVHSGFSGPATGEAHVALRTEFEGRIEQLLNDEDEGHEVLEANLAARAWNSAAPNGGSTTVFTHQPDDSWIAHVTPLKGGQTVKHAVRLVGTDAVWVGDTPYRLDAVARVLISPRGFGERLMPAGALDSALLADSGFPGIRDMPAALLHADARIRREALWSMGHRRARAAGSLAADFLPLVADPEVEVAIAAAWAISVCGDLEATEHLLALTGHANARVRREIARGLVRLAAQRPALRAEFEHLKQDPDPLVRGIVGGQ
ncbi:MAG: thiol-disulfide isomerase/thioredoxin [Gammaproteobacteria bacterium]|jgi:thiol-disulfide isomerase/thioredoxin